MLKHVNRSLSKSPENRGSLAGLKFESSDFGTKTIQTKRRCNSALPRSRNSNLRPSLKSSQEYLKKYRNPTESGEETTRNSLRQIRRTYSAPKL